MTSIVTERPRALDGAMGTALIARGLDVRVAPETWLVERADEISAVHAAHVAAGAEVLLTCTFNLASRRVTGDVEDLAARAVDVARAAAAGAAVAGAVGPTGAWAAGLPTPRAAATAALYSRALGALAAHAPDLLWVESQYSAAEARAALRCAVQIGLPVAVTVTYAGGPSPGSPALLPDGTAVEGLLCELAELGACAVGVNCVLPGTQGLAALISAVSARVRVPVVAKPSAGLPGHVISPGEFGAWCDELRGAGAAWIGGCCGATAEHVAEAARAVHGGRAQPRA